MGHATRCIPIINYLVETGRQVFIAAGGRPRNLLEAEFPDLKILPLPGYDIRYPADGSMTAAMATQLPKILKNIWIEHYWLKKWASIEQPALIISDNRFGLFHKSIPSIYITHQLTIKTPPRLDYLQPTLAKLHSWIIEHFTECWIPDYANPPGLAGELSHPPTLPKNARYIGPLSRFDKMSLTPRQIDLYTENLDLFVILSGPEPQRSIFEEMILDQLPKTGLRAVVIEGRSEEDTDEWITDRVRLVSRMTSQDIKTTLEQASVVLSRPGYSSVMDLATLGKPAIFVPTPGQTEQEYLADRLASDWGSVVIKQEHFDLKKAWNKVGKVGRKPAAIDPGLSFIPFLERLLQKQGA